ncbi:unnamed protein product [Symbiodinium necroappetens]|uniref:Uncharacterized protein n=1 Tax=Symbiodinium necroappetens TaxID=1628268 RepID=A0A812T6H6_9DINO|nr:unnamed protein product [Symbiodinium necroappetens]
MAKGLAKKWETVACVRNRFRNGQDWLKLKIGGDGTTRVAACATSFRQNAEIVSCMLQTSGLEKQGLPALTKQVAALFQKMGFIPEDFNVREVMQMIGKLQAGEAVSESAYAALQSGLSEDEASDEEDDGAGDGGEEEGEKEDDEGDAVPDGGDDEDLEEGEPKPKEKKVAPAAKLKKLLPLPSGKGTLVKARPTSSPDAAMFPEIRPSPTSAGSGRSPDEIELAQCLGRIKDLEKAVETQLVDDVDLALAVEQASKSPPTASTTPKAVEPLTLSAEEQQALRASMKKSKQKKASPKGSEDDDSSKSMPKAKAKAKAKGKVLKKPSARFVPALVPVDPVGSEGDGGDAPERVLGCSRCRYGKTGCTQCRKKDYKPRGPRRKQDS